MADLKQDLDNALNPPVADTPQSIKLGDKEYTQEELQAAVGAQQMVRELEEKWDTKIDKVYPKYTQASTRLKELETENEQLKQKATSTYDPNSDISEEARQEAIKAARKIGILTREDMKDLGYMNKKEVEEFIAERESASSLISKMNSIQEKIDGKDGRPAFKTAEVLEYMAANGFSRNADPERVYKLMYEDKLDAWKEKHIADAKKPGLTTDTTSAVGVKLPPEVKVTKENRDALVAAALRGE